MDFEVETEEDIVPDDGRPAMHDINWPDFVMSHFDESELVKKVVYGTEKSFPKVDGLRRVVELLLGPIIQGQARTIECSRPDNDYTATVEYTVKIRCTKTGGTDRVFTSVADAGLNNADPIFRRFAPQLAETRAEGRALRKALRLNVVAFEELSKTAEEDTVDVGEPATGNDLIILKRECTKRKIDYDKFCSDNKIGPKVSKAKVKALMLELYGEG